MPSTGLPIMRWRRVHLVGLAIAGILLPVVTIADQPAGTGEVKPIPRCKVYKSDKGPLLLGEVTRDDILSHFPEWQQEYDAYQPDPEIVAELAAVSQPVTITCILGTWCSDSEREVPRFWKLLDAVADPRFELTMLACGRRSDAEAEAALLTELELPASLRDTYGVEFVPTFIFQRGDRELGRIVETPEATLEEDTARILTRTPEAHSPVEWY